MKTTAEDRCLIKLLRQEKKWGAKKILKEFPNKAWSLKTVNNIISKVDQYGTAERRPGSGRPRSARTAKNIQETEELVLSQEDNPGSHLSQREIGRKLGVAQSSVNRIVKQDLQLRCFKKFRVEELKPGEKLRREERATELLRRYPNATSLRRVWFSDESIFTLNKRVNAQNDRVYGRHPEARRRQVTPERIEAASRSQGDRVMVGGCVSAMGKTSLVFIDSCVRLNQHSYRQILEKHYFPDIREICGSNWTFQQDGAPCHTAHSVVEFLEQACPAFIKPDAWPPKSPDLSPLDFFVWSELERQVYRGQRISTIQELKARLTACWNELSQRQLVRAVAAVPKRLQACVAARGARFEHMIC